MTVYEIDFLAPQTIPSTKINISYSLMPHIKHVYVSDDIKQPYTDTLAQTFSCKLNGTLEQKAEASDLSKTLWRPLL